MKSTILLTRPYGRSTDFIKKLNLLGYKTIEMPCIAIQPLQAIDHQEINFTTDFTKYTIIIFVSVNAVTSFFALFSKNKIHHHTKIMAIGSATAGKLKSYGFTQVTYPDDSLQTSENFINLPELQDIKQANILLIRGDTSREYLANNLKQRSMSFTELITYNTTAANIDLTLLDKLEPNLIIIITSVKILENFYDKLFNSGLDITMKHKILAAPLLVVSARIGMIARSKGFKNINITNSMADGIIIGMIEKLDNKQCRITQNARQ